MCYYMFLHFQLLEFDKLAASGLKVETSSRFVDSTVLAWTHDQWHEAGRGDLAKNII